MYDYHIDVAMKPLARSVGASVARLEGQFVTIKSTVGMPWQAISNDRYDVYGLEPIRAAV